MKNNTVVFIATSDYDNLGVGYLASVLTDAGYKTRTFDFRTGKSYLLKTLKRINPLLIGFSVIYQNFINDYVSLIGYLRKGGINCHFTAGGHYASLRYTDLFRMAPALDSIIRFEGEYPITVLAHRLSEGQNWQNISSLVSRNNEQVIANPVWKHETDLDKFPFPFRNPLKKYAFRKKFTVIIAGRGCVYNCSFCNTRAFYTMASCPVKRIRRPEMVVSEMNWLYLKKGCRVFLFHDDDFPVRSKNRNDWIIRFCDELERTGLNRKIIWKINCRPDEIDEEIFSLMKKNGLFMVFLGLEDGTDEGLKRLNKQMSVERSKSGLAILKKLEIDFDFGFMLFQPSTTHKSLNENLDFLEYVCGDGCTPVTFLRLIPLYETSIEAELIRSGNYYPVENAIDYLFREESMNRYYNFIMDCFTVWLRDREGMENLSKWARNYLAVYRHFFDDPAGLEYYRKLIHRTISASNHFLIDNIKKLSEIFKRDDDTEKNELLASYQKNIFIQHLRYRNRIIRTMAQFLSYVEDNNIKPYI